MVSAKIHFDCYSLLYCSIFDFDVALYNQVRSFYLFAYRAVFNLKLLNSTLRTAQNVFAASIVYSCLL